MTTIKNLFIAMALVFAVTFSEAMAQETAKKEYTPEEIAQKQTQKLTKELKLTDEQQKTTYDINLKYAQEKGELRQSMKRAKRLMEKHDAELKAILNNEQKVQLDSLRTVQREKIKQARVQRKQAEQVTE